LNATGQILVQKVRQFLELLPSAFAGGLLPLLVTLGIIVIILDSGALMPVEDDLDRKLSVLFSVAGMGLGCVIVAMWSWGLVRKHSALFKMCSVLSALASVALLGIIGSTIASQAGETYGDYYVEHAIFLSGPLVIICIGLMSFALRNVKGAANRVLLLGTFLAATIAVQLFLLRGKFSNPEMLIWNLNSLLVGLAFAFCLGAWGAREFRRT
jgi:hypothetical protein